MIALPVALAGLVTPVLTVTAMLLSGLTVVGDSARIARRVSDETTGHQG
jgi:cation transport ATPase